MTMNVEEIQKEAIYSSNQGRLFEIIIELNEEISRHHVELVEAETVLEKTVVKGKISLLTTLQNIINKRIEDPKVFFGESIERKEMMANRQFRIAAEMVLNKETYRRISELSVMNYKKLKDQKEELKSSKLE